MRIKDIPREEGGSLPAYAWPGGYPIAYVDAEANDLCPKCATKVEQECTAGFRDKPALVGGDIYYEGPALTCVDCGAVIESAYGDPDAEKGV